MTDVIVGFQVTFIHANPYSGKGLCLTSSQIGTKICEKPILIW